VKEELASVRRFLVYFLFRVTDLNSTPQFLSIIDYTDIYLSFQISPQSKSRGFKSGERAGQEVELHGRDESTVGDNFWASIDALHDSKLVEYRRVEMLVE
jgi:hypothetical protein